LGSISILNNVAGLNAQNQLSINNLNLSKTLLRPASGIPAPNTGASPKR
jgi:flagellin-like hook-associated protein FlgL